MSNRPFLKGGKTVLRPVEHGDILVIAKWLNDPVVTHTMFYGQLPMSEEQVEAMIMGQVRSPANTVFMVETTSGISIGFAGLYDIHLTARKASFRILIGETDHWKKGFGTEVTEMLTFYGFDRLNLNRISLGVTADNVGAVRAYEKAGFVVEGTLRKDLYRNGRWYDSILMAILREEYDAKLAADFSERFTQKLKTDR
jgi:ribosomal-protein-alanine N-acetyltransferase